MERSIALPSKSNRAVVVRREEAQRGTGRPAHDGYPESLGDGAGLSEFGLLLGPAIDVGPGQGARGEQRVIGHRGQPSPGPPLIGQIGVP